jgi:hypothetical protein
MAHLADYARAGRAKKALAWHGNCAAPRVCGVPCAAARLAQRDGLRGSALAVSSRALPAPGLRPCSLAGSAAPHLRLPLAVSRHTRRHRAGRGR